MPLCSSVLFSREIPTIVGSSVSLVNVKIVPKHKELTVKSAVVLLAGWHADYVWNCRAPKAKLKNIYALLKKLGKIDIFNYRSKFYIIPGWRT